MVPNAFTLMNLLLGILSLTYTMSGSFTLAAIAILLSAALDRVDGNLARRLGVSSDFGKELDSLADLVSFGVAPAILAYAAVLNPPLGVWGLVIAILFAACGAIRLARFNILNIGDHFLGVPITIAGGLIAAAMLIANRLPFWAMAFVMVSLSALMVSKIRIPKM
ncbi:MAG: CDP-diacylglycerol--serine O-phosphatidyltransferase [Firmicutes bacterium]|nr:CDP-diacylglycerol--serine O-phosphatidyltransferase [Bacillota bacterium]